MLYPKKIKIVNYSKKYLKGHQEFARRQWGKRKRGEPDYLFYKHREKKKKSFENLIIALSGNKVVGQIGLIPTELVLKDKLIDCFWICDLMVDPEYRKYGVAMQLYKNILNRKIFLIGSNPSINSEITFKLLRFQKIEGPNVWFFPIEFEGVIKMKFGNKFKWLQKILAYWISILHGLLFHSINKSFSKSNFSNWGKIFSIHNRFQNTLKIPHILHDEKFLEWRGNGLKGYSAKIMGLFRGKNSYLYYGLGSECLYIYEWKISDLQTARSMFNTLIILAKKHKKNRLELISNFHFENMMLKKLGWIKFRTPVLLYYYSPKPIYKLKKFYYTIYDSDGNL